MRSLLVAAVLSAVGLLSGCGGPCSSPYDGSWVGRSSNDKLTLDDQCNFIYTGRDGCQSLGIYGQPLSTSGTAAVSVSSENPYNDGACLSAGSYACTYQASSVLLTFDCGGGLVSYGR